MDFLPSNAGFCDDSLPAGLLIFVMVVGLVQAVGCEKQSSAPDTPGAMPRGRSGQLGNRGAKPSGAPVSGAPMTAQGVLEKMAEAYRTAPSYEDFATAELGTRQHGTPASRFQGGFQRPNKLANEVLSGQVVCDGKKWYAFSKDIPGQAVLRDAPGKLNLQMLQADTVLNQVLNNGFAGGSPQLLLLLEEKPLPITPRRRAQPGSTLDEPGRIGDYDCYRVRFNRNDGAGEYWIDQKTFVLRQVRFHQSSAPPGREGEAGGRRQHGGQFRACPAGRRDRSFGLPSRSARRRAMPSCAGGSRALRVDRQEAADFQLVDMQGKPWSSQAIDRKGGRAAPLAEQRRGLLCPSFPRSSRPTTSSKTTPRWRFGRSTWTARKWTTKTIEETARKWKLSVPILRDPEIETPKLLRISALPATFFLDAKGVLQDCIVGDQSPGSRRDNTQAGKTAGR